MYSIYAIIIDYLNLYIIQLTVQFKQQKRIRGFETAIPKVTVN